MANVTPNWRYAGRAPCRVGACAAGALLPCRIRAAATKQLSAPFLWRRFLPVEWRAIFICGVGWAAGVRWLRVTSLDTDTVIPPTMFNRNANTPGKFNGKRLSKRLSNARVWSGYPDNVGRVKRCNKCGVVVAPGGRREGAGGGCHELRMRTAPATEMRTST